MSERIELYHDVPLVPQMTGMSCWAAAAAMIVGWRECVPVDPEALAQGAGRWAEYRDGLLPDDLDSLKASWDLVELHPGVLTVASLHALLRTSGPLWIGEADPGLHVIVLCGIEGDGTPEGTYVNCADPWPVGRGERYRMRVAELLDNVLAVERLAGTHARLLHGGPRAVARLRGTVPVRAWPAGQGPGPTHPINPRPNTSSSIQTFGPRFAPPRPHEVNMSEIILDPGHGGAAGLGKSSAYGHRTASLVEKDVNLELARAVAQRLGGRGTLTRDGDVNLSLADRRARVRPNTRAFVSIHGGSEPGRGNQVWVHPRGPAASRELGNHLAAVLGGRVRNDVDLAILDPSGPTGRVPACLVEVDMLEAARGSARMGTAIATGLDRFLYSKGQVDPATVSAAVAVGTLGYNVIKDSLTSSGDISYQLTRMEGVWYPAKDTNPSRWQQWAGVEPYQKYSTWFGWWNSNYIGDEISAYFDLEWWGNGYAVAAARMSKRSTNDAVGWGLTVESDMMPYPSLSAQPPSTAYNIASVGLRVTYTFDRSIGGNILRRHDIRFYGDGDYTITKTNL